MRGGEEERSCRFPFSFFLLSSFLVCLLALCRFFPLVTRFVQSHTMGRYSLERKQQKKPLFRCSHLEEKKDTMLGLRDAVSSRGEERRKRWLWTRGWLWTGVERVKRGRKEGEEGRKDEDENESIRCCASREREQGRGGTRGAQNHF